MVDSSPAVANGVVCQGGYVVSATCEVMQAEEVDLGMFVTSGVFSEEFLNRAAKLKVENGLAIEVVDGEQLATMIVEGGLRLELKH